MNGDLVMRCCRCHLMLSLVVLVGVALSGGMAGGETRPNVVVLYADDMGYGDLAAQNPASKIPTPHLDQLAAEGMRFTDAHSSSSICSPSRYALLTGRYHWRKLHGIVNTFGAPALDEAELTLAGLLKRHGYRTACIGKWHLGWDWAAIRRAGATSTPEAGYEWDDFDWSQPVPGGPLDHGFDYYFGDDVPNFPPYAWIENDRLLEAPNGPLAIEQLTAEGEWETRRGPMVAGWDFYAVMPKLTNRAVEWIAEQWGSGQPFFLYVPFTAPHTPIVPATEYVGASDAGGYGDFVVQTDAAVGAILEALDANGFGENTLVIFSSDNGPEQYAYDRLRNFEHRSAGPLRGLKRDLWEGGHRVPLIVRWPGVIGAAEVNDALISQIDLFATIAAATGSALPPGAAEDSLNFLPVWTRGERGPRRTLIHCNLKKRYAVRHGQWLLIVAETGKATKVPSWFDEQEGYQPHNQAGELYDLTSDLRQSRNLYQSRPEKVAELLALLAAVRDQ